MGCAEFCAILSFIGTLFLCLLGVLVASNSPFLDWHLKGNARSKTTSALFISAGLYFVLFVCSMIYKARIDKRLAEEEMNKGGRMRLISHDENSSQMDLDSKPNRQQQQQQPVSGSIN